jgi:hypothetical protein
MERRGRNSLGLAGVIFLLSKLGNRRITGVELGAELALYPRGISDFFDALVAMNFLDREGDGPSAKYFNTAASALHLDSSNPRYVGGWLVMPCSPWKDSPPSTIALASS